LESLWFIPIGQLMSNEELRNYLEFYQAVGVTSHLTDCAAEIVGPSAVVTCEADQQIEALLPLDLRFPAFDMTFDVSDDGIRTIGWVQHDPLDFNTAFRNSRFFEFNAAVLAPEGLLQDSGDPIWSKENGERMAQLVDEFLADGG